MERFNCTVDNQGRITIPASWRKANKVHSGMKLGITVDDTGLKIQTLAQSVREAQQIVAKYLGKRKKSLVEDLLRERRREARLEEKEAARYAKRLR
jgi:bifunctional DNA-binding transcriptional regulator/antitoxin component of YhaV-PrlF toxin-antitoxin module